MALSDRTGEAKRETKEERKRRRKKKRKEKGGGGKGGGKKKKEENSSFFFFFHHPFLLSFPSPFPSSHKHFTKSGKVRGEHNRF